MTVDGLLSAFSPKLHSIAMFICSGYVLAVVFSVLGYGENGMQNIALILSLFGLESPLGWLQGFESRIQSSEYQPGLEMLLTVWTTLGLLLIAGCYKDGCPQSLPPESVIATAFFYALNVDFLGGPATFGEMVLFLCMVGIAVITFNLPHGINQIFESVSIALVAVVLVPIYSLLAPAAWLLSAREIKSSSS